MIMKHFDRIIGYQLFFRTQKHKWGLKKLPLLKAPAKLNLMHIYPPEMGNMKLRP